MLKEFFSLLEEYIVDEGDSDHMIWTHSIYENFTRKSFREELVQGDMDESKWKSLWRVVVPLNVKAFIWLILRGMAPI